MLARELANDDFFKFKHQPAKAAQISKLAYQMKLMGAKEVRVGFARRPLRNKVYWGRHLPSEMNSDKTTHHPPLELSSNLPK
jgi:hypothetical protein